MQQELEALRALTRMQEAQLEYLISDETPQILYAQNHTGLPIEYWPEF